MGIHKWELGIYIGFSPALHLQCGQTILYSTVVALKLCCFAKRPPTPPPLPAKEADMMTGQKGAVK
jgi:hypothetical protein